MYENLLAYLEEHGDCRVPATYKDKKLGRWMAKQRKEFKEEAMADERKELLNAVDFTWTVGLGNYERPF